MKRATRRDEPIASFVLVSSNGTGYGGLLRIHRKIYVFQTDCSGIGQRTNNFGNCCFVVGDVGITRHKSYFLSGWERGDAMVAR